MNVFVSAFVFASKPTREDSAGTGAKIVAFDFRSPDQLIADPLSSSAADQCFPLNLPLDVLHLAFYPPTAAPPPLRKMHQSNFSWCLS